MAPNIKEMNDVTEENLNTTSKKNEESESTEVKLVWRNIILFVYLHIAALYGFYLMLTSAKIKTALWGIFLYGVGGLGITAGAHRLWAHKSYKARWPLTLLLTIFNTVAFQDAAVDWARDHRVHHKFSETNADPHNAKRGFFFSHVGWLLCRKHPEVRIKGKTIDLSDLTQDPILRFQKKYYLIIMPIFAFVLPTLVPIYFWQETFKNAFFINLLRYTWTLNCTWLVNSAAHLWGNKPYDREINPAENKNVSILALGEGWHNYHHTFPWDYKTSEFGRYTTNLTTMFIDFMAKIGLAYDLKTASEEVVKNRVLRTGDGSHEIWGWGDSDQPKDDINNAIITYKED